MVFAWSTILVAVGETAAAVAALAPALALTVQQIVLASRRMGVRSVQSSTHSLFLWASSAAWHHSWYRGQFGTPSSVASK
ncbi:hypothetical protein [Streptomyces sp. NPDC056464]|uniref:hypothetical protein n=1 Tax=Streptomyces sp. NPDC056464 TaxID=3345828 RepID=UPI0036C971EE